MRLLLIVAVFAVASGPGRASETASAAAPPARRAALPGDFHAAAPTFSDGMFPCTGCHADPGDPRRRELSFHEEVRFEHDAEHRWCLDCHSARNRDVLHLSNGDDLPFGESHRLCGQCHGDKHRDWRSGVHGKRVGFWDGEKTYFLCVNCHDPHSPRFKPIKPEPRPRRPEEMRR